MTAVRSRQRLADLRATFWLRPAIMTVSAAALAELLVRSESAVALPGWLADLVYAGGAAGARDVLGAVAAATIGVAGTTFSITVAALTFASTQMGPRLLRNFTSDPGNQYALGALVATFAYALVALRAVHQGGDGAFVPHLAVSVGLLLAFACAGVLIWFLHHIATTINLDRVIALVHADLSAAVAALPRRRQGVRENVAVPVDTAPLRAPDAGYLRVLDDAGLAAWAEKAGAVVWLRKRPGDFVFPGATIGEVAPAAARASAETALAGRMSFGDTRSVEQDLEFAVRQLVEVGLRALSPSLHDPFTAIAVLDWLGAALCEVADRALPDGRTERDGRVRLSRPATDYAGLVDAMFHMLRQAAKAEPSVLIRLLEVLAEVASVERDRGRCCSLQRHAELARAALGDSADASVQEAMAERYHRFVAVLGPLGTPAESPA